MSKTLIEPHGGTLVNLLLGPEHSEALRVESRSFLSWNLTSRQMCDLELLLCGAFSPLRGFLARADYESVCTTMRLADGTLWPIPIVLDVSDEIANQLAPGTPLALRDPEGVMLAVLHVEDVWKPDRSLEAQTVYGATNAEHRGVYNLFNQTFPQYVSGRLEGIQLPLHYDFIPQRHTPEELRRDFTRLGWHRVVAFHTRQYDASGAPCRNPPGDRGGEGQFIASSDRGLDKARGSRSLHPDSMSSGHSCPLSPTHDETLFAALGDAAGGASRNLVACHCSEKLRLYAYDGRAKFRGPGARFGRQPVL